MLVVPKKKALILKLREPERVTSIIPTAKVVEVRGQQLVAVPHKLDEVRVLRNLGINAPSPIRYYYNFMSGQQRTPFDAQYGTTDFLTTVRNGFVLNDMGTGKTLSVLWAYDYMRSIGEVNKMLVIAPLSTLERVWADEIFMNFPHLSWVVLHGTKERRMKLLKQDVDIYIINHDGIKVKGFVEEMEQRQDIDVIVPDEGAQLARTAGTDRWKVLNKLCNKQGPRRVWWLTGTPVPNRPTDAWAQCRIVSPASVPAYFNRFRDTVMTQSGPFLWKNRPNAMDTVFSVMQPAVRYTRDACVDLPPCMYQTRHVAMHPEQTAAYKDMQNKLHAEMEEGSITAVNEAVKVSKLLQIACGAVYGPHKEVIDIASQGRIDVVHEIIEEAAGKVIVFVPFVGALGKIATELARLLAPDGHEVAVIHGGVSQKDRSEIFQNFQKSANPRVLIAQPGAMSHGLTLTEANTIVWYSACYSNETYEQANARITRPGQKNNQFIIHLEGCAAERKVFERLKVKQSMQNLLLDLVENQQDTVHL